MDPSPPRQCRLPRPFSRHRLARTHCQHRELLATKLKVEANLKTTSGARLGTTSENTTQSAPIAHHLSYNTKPWVGLSLGASISAPISISVKRAHTYTPVAAFALQPKKEAESITSHPLLSPFPRLILQHSAQAHLQLHSCPMPPHFSAAWAHADSS